MTYKYETHKRLADFLKKKGIKDDSNIDWEEVYSFWLKNKEKNKRVESIKTEYQLYQQRARTMNHRAKNAGVLGIVTPEELMAIMTQYRHRCKKCLKTQYLVFDHKIPMYRGGLNIKDNLQVLCRICNMEKGVNQ